MRVASGGFDFCCLYDEAPSSCPFVVVIAGILVGLRVTVVCTIEFEFGEDIASVVCAVVALGLDERFETVQKDDE